jgi:hypothetical protein
MQSEPVLVAEPIEPSNIKRVGISSAIPDAGPRVSSRFKPLLIGLAVTLLQIGIAIFLLAPEGTFEARYNTLIEHDGFWFMNIVDRGYQTIVPPINHKVMEVSNVGFFPAYPMLASLVQKIFDCDSSVALLVVAQIAAWGFWTYFFLFCERWELSPSLRFFGALSILAHPAAFFLIAGYSESLFLMGLLGFIYWSGAEGRAAKILAALHGMVMSATRIVGIPCAAYPVVRNVFAKGWDGLTNYKNWWRNYGSAVALMVAAICGAGLFFVYCQIRWGRWDMYMLTQSAGWNIDPDYLAVFRLSNYRWLIPALNNPREMSQMAMTVGALLLVVIAVCELAAAIRRNTSWRPRVAFYFCAVVIYYISVAGVASIEMESMLRYEFCVHALIVLAFLHFLKQFRLPPVLLRALGTAAAALAGAAGLSIQGWYIWNFTRGNWVA